MQDGNNINIYSALPGGEKFEQFIQETIHVPGLRGNPERDYPATPVIGPNFQGVFQNYTAAIINYWQENNDERLIRLGDWLKTLNLTSHVAAKRLDDTRVQLQVGRTLQSNSQDQVSIADVGFGTSQVLPVLVALLVAESDQLVYIEQPELHLHPRAQVKLAEIIAESAQRGVRVVLETHSDLLLLGIQTLVADDKHEKHLSPDKVILHWFTRNNDGITHITPGMLNKRGAYGDWPEDFGTERFNAQYRYFDVAETSLLESDNVPRNRHSPSIRRKCG